MNDSHINEHLAKALCYKCGASLEGAKLTPISKVSMALIAHTVCPKCAAESIITITLAGSGIMPLISDLRGMEIEKFTGKSPTSYEELFELHSLLKGKNIWKLLQKKDKTKVNKIKD